MDRFEELSKADRFEQLAAQATEQPAKPSLSLGKELLKNTLGQLPYAGSMVGEVLGGPIGGGLGGGIGAAIEKPLKQVFGLEEQQPILEQYKYIAEQGLMGSIGTPVAGIVNKGLGGLGRFMGLVPSKSIQKAAEKPLQDMTNLQAAQVMEKYGIPLSMQGTNPTRPNQIMTDIASKIPVMDVALESQAMKARGMATDVAKKMKTLAMQLSPFTKEEAGNFYADAFNMVESGKIEAPGLKDYLSSVKWSPKDSKIATDALTAFGDGTEIPIEAIAKLKKQLTSLGGDAKSAINNRIYGSLSSLPNGKEIKKALADADDKYSLYAASKMARDLIENSMSKKQHVSYFDSNKFLKKYTNEKRNLISTRLPEVGTALDDLMVIADKVKGDIELFSGASTAGKGLAEKTADTILRPAASLLARPLMGQGVTSRLIKRPLSGRGVMNQYPEDAIQQLVRWITMQNPSSF
jgi:hypothetical protein